MLGAGETRPRHIPPDSNCLARPRRKSTRSDSMTWAQHAPQGVVAPFGTPVLYAGTEHSHFSRVQTRRIVVCACNTPHLNGAGEACGKPNAPDAKGALRQARPAKRLGFARTTMTHYVCTVASHGATAQTNAPGYPNRNIVGTGYPLRGPSTAS